jgi:hypothetical protein
MAKEAPQSPRGCLVFHDDRCRIWLMQLGVMNVAAIAASAILLNATGFRTPVVYLIVPALAVALAGSCLVSSIELRARVRVLRHLLHSGIRVPVALTDVEWSEDPESPWGNGVWNYHYDGRRFEIHALESLWASVRTEAIALVDPDRPERAVLLMPNRFTRGGYQLSARSRMWQVLVPIGHVAAWGVWVLAAGLALTR